jgi:hypothetical protein
MNASRTGLSPLTVLDVGREESCEWRGSETFQASLKFAVFLIGLAGKIARDQHRTANADYSSSSWSGVLDSRFLVHSMVKTGKENSEQDVSETSTLSGAQDVVRVTVFFISQDH